jgi:hypothetical protein
MIDIKLIRTDPELVKENIKKKFQNEKLPLVDEVAELDKKFREAKSRGDYLRSQRNSVSKQIGVLMSKGMKEAAEKNKAAVTAMAKELGELEQTRAGADRENPRKNDDDTEYHRRHRAHRQKRHRERRGGALRRAGGAGLRDAVPCGHHGKVLAA